MKVLILLICVGLALSARRSYERYAPEYADKYFEEFISTHNKVYADEAEKQNRFEIFKNNLEKINERNAKDKSAVFGVTRFSDLTTEEFLQLHTGLKGFDATSCSNPPPPSDAAPESLDWREQGVVTRVKDQGQCGSCWAFAAVGNLESQYIMKNKKQLEFSEQQLVDCDDRSNGCLGGGLDNPFLYWQENAGPELEEDYPYSAVKQQCSFDGSKVKVKVAGCTAYQPESEDQMKLMLHKSGPMVVGVDASSFQSYNGGILGDCSFREMNHAVLLVGYGTEGGVPYWLIKNSWGGVFGESGYIRIKRGVNACGIGSSQLITGDIA